MTATLPRTSGSRRVLAFAACLAALAACARDEHSKTVLSLPAQLAVAEVDGDVESVESVLRIRSGSEVTYHLAVPEAARLRGSSASRDGAAPRVEMQIASGTPQLLAARPGDLDADLTDHAGEMARITFSASGDRGGAVEWRGLRVESGPRSRPRARLTRGRYNVLLVLFDSLRSDQLAPYGNTKVLTPAVQELADAGVTFGRARATASWTRPSVAGMLTSRVAPSHGVLTYEDELPDSLPYLPQLLQDAGYRTVSVVNNAMVSRAFGFARGFDEAIELFDVRDAPRRTVDPRVHGRAVWSRFVAPALERAGEEPFFVYLHELDPHSPYDPPKPFDQLYDFGYHGDASSTLEGLRAIRERPQDVRPDDIRHLRAQYRGEITYVDRYLAGVLQALADAGLSETTVVVLVSDHGEEFFEHGSVGHGHAVYEELLQVPFLVRLPGVLPAGRRVEADVSLVDLAPTLLDLLGLDVPEQMQGETLLPRLEDPEAPPRPHFAYAAVPPSESVSYGRWKLIRDGSDSTKPASLFDLRDDPAEQTNVADAHPVVVGTLAQMLRSQRVGAVSSERAPMAELPEAVLENLRALGYGE